ncbi:undecaprenyl-diphosphate phosphatase [Aureispira anguillae]|uniref:Undecaprenyl-diphosphatase n=1 Tax=Aureispira anguillae TaxID=2864201 RepID=A0A916DU09_9BACT|nr:undecaprenyl-diphosphate phosphatase [Aureispira anguillae]BDS11891.1 undecaprenyl-diphosphate phosphatase [Aureispira anguillae]
MDWLEALILGMIQGLTEYLPVSSSGHLELGKILLDINPSKTDESFGITFNVVLHLATVFSTWVILRKEIAEIFRGLFQFKMNEEFWFSAKIVVSMIPAGIIGLLFEEQIDATFRGSALLVGLMLLITGALLFLADKAKATTGKVGFKEALLVGIAQAVALAPGISRSGATISTCVLLKIDKERATRFSFLMVMPLILGKVAKDLLDDKFALATETLLPMGIGFIASFVVGLVACQWMINLVKNGKLVYFSIYCFIVGAIAIGYSLV